MPEPLLVLSDSAVKDILLNLTKFELFAFQDALQDSLKQYSTTSERQYQPDSGVVVRPDGQKVLWRPFTSPTSVGTKIIVDPAPAEDGSAKAPLHGILTILDEAGLPQGVINAEEVTAFRTSLSALIPFRWRSRVGHVVVFGAGKQALWHCRLALGMREKDVQSIVLVNRTRGRAEAVMKMLSEENARKERKEIEISVLSPESEGYEDQLRKRLSRADVVFCTVPSTEPLFDAGDLGDGQPLVTAIGSWQPDMIELDPALLRRVVESGKKVIVDDRKTCMHHTGEILRAKLKDEQVLEIGEVLHTRADRSTLNWLSQWLEDGLMVYKSIGVSMTDLIAGNEILSIARKKRVGIVIPEF